jgi:spore coat polysaccharide biosynthesis protein SpsF
MRTHPEEYRVGGIALPAGEDYGNIRITVDTRQDYALACVLKTMIKPDQISFREIVKLLSDRPYLKIINETSLEKKEYVNIGDEMEDAIRLLRLQEMNDTADMIERELSRKRGLG